MLFYAKGSKDTVINPEEMKQELFETLTKLGDKNKVLAIPPDFTRYHSKAGELTQYVYEYYGNKLTDILPALGTHFEMTENELFKMYGNIPRSLFRVHKWKSDLVTLGRVPAEYVNKVSEGKVNYDWPAQVNKLLVEGGHDLILSIGQVVPHEVVGMANYNKNIFVGTGGQEGINKSHFLGAAYGMEKMMGRADTPVRRVLNYATDHFANDLPLIYVQTVIGKDKNNDLVMRGLFIGDDYECFEMAAQLSLEVNFEMLDKPLDKIVVYLDPEEFKSTWLGNKAIYRTRMAIADGGELIVLAPSVSKFGEDKENDRLIRKYGYVGRKNVLQLVKENSDLQNNLSVAAHLIHGSSDDRFNITYAVDKLTKEEIGGANYKYLDYKETIKKYDPKKLKEGVNIMEDGEQIYYISNPALGLWAERSKFF